LVQDNENKDFWGKSIRGLDSEKIIINNNIPSYQARAIIGPIYIPALYSPFPSFVDLPNEYLPHTSQLHG
jgi:hypothetical protein